RIIYIYHNQIDRKGHDSNKATHEVFAACADEINEIVNFIRKVVDTTSTTNFIVTSDHGFIYKYNLLSNDYKIDSTALEGDDLADRYVISQSPIIEDGIASLCL